jgi:hypothetical protein
LNFFLCSISCSSTGNSFHSSGPLTLKPHLAALLLAILQNMFSDLLVVDLVLWPRLLLLFLKRAGVNIFPFEPMNHRVKTFEQVGKNFGVIICELSSPTFYRQYFSYPLFPTNFFLYQSFFYIYFFPHQPFSHQPFFLPNFFPTNFFPHQLFVSPTFVPTKNFPHQNFSPPTVFPTNFLSSTFFYSMFYLHQILSPPFFLPTNFFPHKHFFLPNIFPMNFSPTFSFM